MIAHGLLIQYTRISLNQEVLFLFGPTQGALREHRTEDQRDKHPPHIKYQFPQHVDLILASRYTGAARGNWPEDCGNIEETSSLEKAEVQSRIMQLWRGSVRR
jgi:hypothetical protein